MRFVDSANLIVQAGAGGDGITSFRREKYIPRGGPNGGNGGDGASIYFVGSSSLHSLLDYKYRSLYKASSGEKGRGNNCFGAAGKDVFLPVPLGTVVHNTETDEVIGEILKEEQTLLVAKGGKGGLGNASFKSSVNRAPTKSTPGTLGESRKLHIELKVLSDAALVGMPNAGKSSLLSVLSAARPKVADYPFTTLQPNPGIVNIGLQADEQPFVITDIPGIIEGAAQGQGLGIDFLKHIQRSLLLIHVVDLSSDDMLKDIAIFDGELSAFSAALAAMPKWILANKSDLLDDEELEEKKQLLIKNYCTDGVKLFVSSAHERTGLEDLSRAIRDFLNRRSEQDDAMKDTIKEPLALDEEPSAKSLRY